MAFATCDLGGHHFFDRFVRLRELERNEQPDQRPGRIDFTFAETELRTARITVVVVVEPFATGQ